MLSFALFVGLGLGSGLDLAPEETLLWPRASVPASIGLLVASCSGATFGRQLLFDIVAILRLCLGRRSATSEAGWARLKDAVSCPALVRLELLLVEELEGIVDGIRAGACCLPRTSTSCRLAWPWLGPPPLDPEVVLLVFFEAEVRLNLPGLGP